MPYIPPISIIKLLILTISNVKHYTIDLENKNDVCVYIPPLIVMIADNMLLYFAHNVGNDKRTGGHSSNNSDIERYASKKHARGYEKTR